MSYRALLTSTPLSRHVGNIPFQIICIFLAMDVRESLSNIGNAMRILEEVAERYQTASVKEALKTARFLVRLSKKRKDEDSDILNLSLKRSRATYESTQPEDATEPQPPVEDNNTLMASSGPSTTTTTNEDWSLDLWNGLEFDWNDILTADMQMMPNLAPEPIS
jgi:hypothetical protein